MSGLTVMRHLRVVLKVKDCLLRVLSVVYAIGAIAVLLSAVASASEFEEMLSEFRWKSRVLLVFADDVEDARVKALTAAIDNAACEVSERDMLVGLITQGGKNVIAGEALSRDSASRVRARFGIGAADFRILLIGKDGGVKATYRKVPELFDVFGLIDGMPMRRRETNTQSTSCTEWLRLAIRHNPVIARWLSGITLCFAKSSWGVESARRCSSTLRWRHPPGPLFRLPPSH